MNILKKYNKKKSKRNHQKMIKDSNLKTENVEYMNIIHANHNLKLDYKFIVKDEYEINKLSYINYIHKSNKEKINKILEALNLNEEKIYNNSTNKIIKENVIVTRKIIGDGNSFFPSLSFFSHIQKILKIILEIVYIYI